MAKIPGLSAAADKEDVIRLAALLPAVDDAICGVPVKPLTLRHLTILRLAQNSFVCGWDRDQAPAPADIAQFMWVVSPAFRIGGGWRKRLFLRMISRRSAIDLVRGICEYLTESFMDAPGGEGRREQHLAAAITLTEMFASEYGWPVDYTLNLPLKLAFQIEKARALRHGGSTWRGSFSGRAIQGWLDADRNRN